MHFDSAKSHRLSKLVIALCQRAHHIAEKFIESMEFKGNLVDFTATLVQNGHKWRFEHAQRAVEILGAHYVIPQSELWSHVFEGTQVFDVDTT
jgi:hypothetical protein